MCHIGVAETSYDVSVNKQGMADGEADMTRDKTSEDFSEIQPGTPEALQAANVCFMSAIMLCLPVYAVNN